MGLKLDALLKDKNKEFKEEILTKGLPTYECDRIPFTSPRMNYCSYGGIPIGKIVEFYGEEHGGKTTTALDIVANYQHMSDAKDVLYIDAENTLDVTWATKLGVDIDSMYILQPKGQSAEEIFQVIYEAVDSGEVGLWVLDSIGALISQQEYDKDITEKAYGGVSKPLTVFVKKIEMLMARHRCTGIGINQLRDNFNSPYGGKITTGGMGWKYLCSVRMEFSRGAFIDEKGNELPRRAENPVGNIVLMSMTKNKFAPSDRRTGFYTLNYMAGIDYLKDLVDVAIKYDIIEKAGAWFKIVDTESGEIIVDKIHGLPQVYQTLEENEEALKIIESCVEQRMNDRS